MKTMAMHFLAVLPLVISAAFAQDTFLTVEEAGPDYAIQGEYVGEIKNGDNAVKMGLQVIALGNHEFDAVAYPGGLPGDGWTGDEKIRGNGSTAEGQTKIVATGHGYALVRDSEAVLYSESGEQAGILKPPGLT